jgi:hypothetical protein
MVRGQDEYALTFSANTGLVARYQPTFDRVAQSFRFLGK